MIELVLDDPDRSVGEEFAMARLLHRKRKALENEWKRQYRRRNAADGRCVQCKNPPKPGCLRCVACLARNRARVNAWRAAGWRPSQAKKRRVGSGLTK